MRSRLRNKHQAVGPRPRLLILTSSFPRDPSDETCGYIRDFARSLSQQFRVQVLAPADRRASRWPADSFTLFRSRALVPRSLDPLQSSSDFNRLLTASTAARLAAVVSLASFFLRALWLAARADAICTHWMAPSGLIGSLIARAAGKPHVCVEHSGALHLLGRMRGGARIARFIAEGADQIVTVSSDLKDKLTALCPGARAKITVIPMGIHSRHAECFDERRTPQTPRTILFVGRLTPIKGVDVLLKAAEQIPAARVVIAGDGDSRPELERLARELQVDAEFCGRVSAEERDRLLSDCEVAVVPSLISSSGRTEGMPVVCLEAMAAARPVIASRAGGLSEIIEDGSNGLLFDPGDHYALACKLKAVLGDPNLRARLSRGAARTAGLYDWSEVGSKYAEIITESLRKNDPNKHRKREKAAGTAGGYN